MAYRKKVETWLESNCRFWGHQVKLDLVDSDCTSYVWHLVQGKTRYAITYSDLGELSLSATSTRHATLDSVRHIYQGDSSEASFSELTRLLSDNFTQQV